MTAIEKLQMLIEAAEYLDRRERGKDVLRRMKMIYFACKLILTLLLGFLPAIKQCCCDLLFIRRMHDMHGLFYCCYDIWRSDRFRDSVLTSTHALVFVGDTNEPLTPSRDRTQAHMA